MQKIVKNKQLSKLTYKRMNSSRLILLFTPMIKNLIKRFGEHWFLKDMENDLILKLLTLQQSYKPSLGAFPSYIKPYMYQYALESRARNFNNIYMPTSSMTNLINSDKPLPSTIQLPMDDDEEIADAFKHIDKEENESQIFTVIKIILEKIRDSDYGDEMKMRLKNNLREFIENPNKKNLGTIKKFKTLLKGTILETYFNK